jgi:glutathione S-transferase
VTLDFSKHEQKEPWFLAINPNGRIPALIDTDENGREIKIFESGAILLYLIATYDDDRKVSYPHGSAEHWETISWVCLIARRFVIFLLM